MTMRLLPMMETADLVLYSAGLTSCDTGYPNPAFDDTCDTKTASDEKGGMAVIYNTCIRSGSMSFFYSKVYKL